MCHIATRSERNFACGKIFPCVHAEGMGECVTANSVDIAHCYPPQTGDNKRENDIRSPQSRHGCPLTRTCRINATKSPFGLFKEISPKRNFFQRDPKAIVIATRVPLFQCRFATLKFTPPALCGRKGNFALCGARVGALPQHPASLREGLTQALLFGAHQNFMSTQHGNTRHRCDRWFHLLFFLPASYNFIARSATRNFGNNKHIVFD